MAGITIDMTPVSVPVSDAAVGHRAQVTAYDLVNRLLSYLGGNPDEPAAADLRRAILDAYREMPGLHAWTYFVQIGRVFLNPACSTGTITYDHCVTPEHEALTRNGWKTYDQLSVSDEILAYDHDTETCSWQPVENIHTFECDGPILNVVRKDRSVLRCTPNHRIPVYERYGRPRKIRKKWVKASELTCDHMTPLSAPIDVESTDEESCRLASLLGWCVTDGHGLFTDRDQVGISQSHKVNFEKCMEIEDLVGRRGWRKDEDSWVYGLLPTDKKKLRSLVENKSDLVRHFCTFGVQEAEAAACAMGMAESSHNVTGQEVFSQWGCNKPVAEAFQIASLLAGRAVNISAKEYDGKIRYQCPVRTRNRIKLNRGSQWEDYKGIVWCPQVKTGAWVVRCNGAVMITGNSGGTYERQLTLVDGTWPDWAARGAVLINGIMSFVDQRVSATVLTLDPTQNPGADVSSGTAYELVQDSYQLPIDFTVGDRGLPENCWGVGLQYVTPAQWLAARRYFHQTGNAWHYTFTADPKAAGRLALRLNPAPLVAGTLDFVYRRRSRDIKIWEQTKGRASVVSGGNVITLSQGGLFTEAHIGSVIRLSDGAVKPPTDLDGIYPYVVERTILQRVSSTQAMVDDAVDTTYANVAYRISDPIDVEPAAMYNALYTAAIRWLCVGRNRKELADATNNWRFSLDLAKEADARDGSLEAAGGGGFGYRPLEFRGPLPAVS